MSFANKKRPPPSDSKINGLCKQLFQEPGLQDGEVVEFQGATGCGKSNVLQHLAIQCLLPKSHMGCGASVIYFDLDYHFELPQFITIVEQRTRGTEEEIKSWLKNLFVVRCESSEQMVISLHSIEPLIVNHKVPVGMLILDSISAFYWIDAQNGNNSRYLQEKNIQKAIQILQVFQENYNITILASTQQLFNVDAKQDTSNPSMFLYKPIMCRQWQDFVKHRFIFLAELDKNGQKIYKALRQTFPNFETQFKITNGGIIFCD